jgi:hypothetical protein
MNNNAFDNFGIEHLSNSSINLYKSNPALWVVRYLHGYKSKTNAAMLRGTVTDHEIGRQFSEPLELKDSIQRGIKEFNSTVKKLKKENNFDTNPDAELKEKTNLAKYLELAIPHYKNLGNPVSYQKKIELQFDEIPVPIIGYLDLEYDGIVRDIKTTGRMLSAVPDSVSRQLSIYSVALGGHVPLVDYIYVTSRKAEVITVQIEDVDRHMSEVKQGAIAIYNLLSTSDELNEITSMFSPDFSDWMWSENEIVEAKKIWSIK